MWRGCYESPTDSDGSLRKSIIDDGASNSILRQGVTGSSSSSTRLFQGTLPTKNNTIQDDSATIHAMNALSVQDREALYEEIHGILPQPIDETPDFVQTKISELKESLSLVPKSQRTALDRAIFLQPSIIHDKKLHLLFLRAVRFDARQAAYLMHMHYEHKLRLFGDTKLVKTITLQDLSPAARKHVREGSLQSHVYNNKGMLAQCTIFSSIASIPDPLAFAQYHFYQNMIALEDEEVQKQGIVRIANLKGKVNLPDILNYARKMGDIIKDRPVRVTAVHILYDNPMVEAVVSTMKKFSVLDYRLRQRLHYGSTMEIQYSLLQFGIYIPEMFRHMLEEEDATALTSSSSATATASSSSSKQKFIDDFLQQRKQVEKENWKKEGQIMIDDKDPEVVAYPAEQDILIGRGWPYQSWSRNKWLVAFASEHAVEYATLQDRNEKKVFLSSLLDTIQNKNNNEGGVGQQRSRFLKRVEGIGWVKVEHSVYREKVAQLLRRAMLDSPTTNSNGSASDDTRTTPSPPHYPQHNNNNNNTQYPRDAGCLLLIEVAMYILQQWVMGRHSRREQFQKDESSFRNEVARVVYAEYHLHPRRKNPPFHFSLVI